MSRMYVTSSDERSTQDGFEDIQIQKDASQSWIVITRKRNKYLSELPEEKVNTFSMKKK